MSKRPDRRAHPGTRPAVTTAEDVYTVKEAAAHMRLSVRTVWNLIGSGQLDSVFVGGRRLIPASAIQRCLDSAKARA